ncbi:efflux RND transporter periplasmic adaptor subunit [Rhizosphaericola mali]|uniref:HlyD family efflux transporter periplasmic adaptor subunit n=1 Tax=Rhizosphaericola mali TaxID=2545455 RepID=A0A5P2GG54_9BACT|nr:HlyD family efflux transporter periplasmic adaptor subunit [Rhizosphaericola mali]QES90681.1 HlyD family efflux transporter periplasmic adaptor subunit [Rhizosphaericola mali]
MKSICINKIYSYSWMMAVLLFLVSCKKAITIRPVHKNIEQSVFANGFVEFDNQYTIAANAAGVLGNQQIKEGDSVVQNQIVATINSQSQQNQVAQSKFIYSNALQNASGSSAQLTSIQQQIDQASSQLELDKVNYQRYNALIKTNSVSKLDYDNAELQYNNSKHNVDILQKKYDDTQLSLNLNKNTSKSQLNSQNAILDNYSAKAITSGVVLNVYHKNGEVLKVGDAIATIGNGGYIIKLYISEDDIVKVTKGQKIALHLNTYSDQTFWAFVTKIYPGFDNDQQSYTIEAKFNQLPAKLFSGTQLQANIQVGEINNALVIPAIYIQKNNTVQLENGTFKTIEIGAKSDQWIQVLSGITENDAIRLPKN